MSPPPEPSSEQLKETLHEQNRHLWGEVRDRQRQRRELLAKMMGVILTASAAATIAAVVGVFSSPLHETPEPRVRASLPLERRLDAVVRDIAELKAAVRAQRPIPARGKLAAEVRRIRSRVSALASQQAALNEALAPDPVKALGVALLQRDLRNAEASTEGSFAAVRADIDRQYDLMKFVVGTLGLGLLGVIGSIIVPAMRDRRLGAREDGEQG